MTPREVSSTAPRTLTAFASPHAMCTFATDTDRCTVADGTVRRYLQGWRCAKHAPDDTADPRRNP